MLIATCLWYASATSIKGHPWVLILWPFFLSPSTYENQPHAVIKCWLCNVLHHFQDSGLGCFLICHLCQMKCREWRRKLHSWSANSQRNKLQTRSNKVSDHLGFALFGLCRDPACERCWITMNMTPVVKNSSPICQFLESIILWVFAHLWKKCFLTFMLFDCCSICSYHGVKLFARNQFAYQKRTATKSTWWVRSSRLVNTWLCSAHCTSIVNRWLLRP